VLTTAPFCIIARFILSSFIKKELLNLLSYDSKAIKKNTIILAHGSINKQKQIREAYENIY